MRSLPDFRARERVFVHRRNESRLIINNEDIQEWT